MDTFESTIRAYQSFLPKQRFGSAASLPESFAIDRFHKKMEKPDKRKDTHLQQECWDEFRAFDHQLPSLISLPSGEWYRARILLHNWIRGSLRSASIDFPKGSSFFATKGFNSIESRLSRGKWSCTPENFDEFSRLVYNHKALKRAFRRRYTRWFQKRGFDLNRQESERFLWLKYKHLSKRDAAYQIFKWKLERIVHFVRGSRFSTVPKNNVKVRPINIEPFGNILVQRQQGNFLRDCLERSVGINLDTLALTHRKRIQDPSNATIDLSNASDSTSIALCRFCLPKKFFDSIMSSRSSMLLGHDGEYHVPKKISSMGNGFTFELMTLVLTAISRVLDKDATVFGDDIIIKKECAPRLIELLTEVGWVVNTEKSFLSGPFRESCGANWHDDFGYIKSYDFKYPITIADCANILNKAYALSKYPTFATLYENLRRLTPKALRGGPFEDYLIESYTESGNSEDLPLYFACFSHGNPVSNKEAGPIKKRLHVSSVSSFVGLRYIPDTASKMVGRLSPNWHWGKYEMYLHSGRQCEDTITGGGRWVKEKLYLIDGRVVRRHPSLNG